MPIHKELRADGRILYLVFTDEWSIRDVIDSHAIDREAMDRATHKIHTVLHMKSQKVPEGLFSMWHSSPTLHHPNSGHLFIINAPPVIRAMAEDMFALSGYKNAHFFENEADTWALLDQLMVEEDQLKAAE
jgi:hypothetical protein